MVNAGAHRVRILEGEVNRLAADPADAAGGKDLFLVPFKRPPVGSIVVGAVALGGGHQSTPLGVFL